MTSATQIAPEAYRARAGSARPECLNKSPEQRSPLYRLSASCRLHYGVEAEIAAVVQIKKEHDSHYRPAVMRNSMCLIPPKLPLLESVTQCSWLR